MNNKTVIFFRHINILLYYLKSIMIFKDFSNNFLTNSISNRYGTEIYFIVLYYPD